MLAWFQLGSAWFLVRDYTKTQHVCNDSGLVLLDFEPKGVAEHIMFAGIHIENQMGPSMVPAWFFLPFGFEHGSGLVPHRGVCKNTLRLLGSCSVQAWFQLGASGFLIANATKHNMFAWFRLGSTWLRIEGCLRTRYARLHSHCKPAVSQPGSSLVSHNGLVPGWFQLCSTWFLIAGLSKTHYVCLVLVWFQLGSSLVPLGSSSRM